MSKEIKKEAPKADVKETKAEVKKEAPKAEVKGYAIYNDRNVLVRTYTESEGKDYADKAKEFAKKKGFTVKAV